MTVDLVAAQSDVVNLRQKLRSRERETEEVLAENARAWGSYVDGKDAFKDIKEIWDMVDQVIRERDAAQKVRGRRILGDRCLSGCLSVCCLSTACILDIF